MTISGWRVWPYLLSLACLPVGAVLEALNDLAAADVPRLVPWAIVAAGVPAAAINALAAFRRGELVLSRAAQH